MKRMTVQLDCKFPIAANECEINFRSRAGNTMLLVHNPTFLDQPLYIVFKRV